MYLWFDRMLDQYFVLGPCRLVCLLLLFLYFCLVVFLRKRCWYRYLYIHKDYRSTRPLGLYFYFLLLQPTGNQWKTYISFTEKAQEREKGEEEKGQRAQAEEVGPCNQSRPSEEGTESKRHRAGSGQCNRGGCWACCWGGSGCVRHSGQGGLTLDEHDTVFHKCIVFLNFKEETKFYGSVYQLETRQKIIYLR